MKKNSTFFFPLIATMLFLLTSISSAAHPFENLFGIYNRDWEKLAETKVNQSALSSDEILLSEENRPFSAIKIRSKKGGINLHRCIFHYKNGEKLTVEMRNNISAGTESRVINLPPGKPRVIKVEFWYDTRNYGDQKAELELWGKS